MVDLLPYQRSDITRSKMKIYVDLGTDEQGFGPLEPIHEALLATGFADRYLWFRGIDGGRHRIADWRRRFAAALLWLYF